MNTSGEIAFELDAIGGVIARATAAIEADTLVDLSALEGRIEGLCCRIEGLPTTEGSKFQARLLALITDFGQLGQLIEAKMGDLKTRMNDITGRHQAASAYAKTSDSGS